MSPDGIELISAGDRTEALHRRGAELIAELERMTASEARLFERIEELRGLLLEVGARWEPVLGPMREAAFGAWKAHGTRERRLELASISEAPLMPEDP